MKAYLIHGVNVRDGGKGSIDRLIPHLKFAGFDPVEIDYGFYGLLRARMCNAGTAHILASILEPGSIAIGHSNGCAVIERAARYGAKFKHVTLINPALDNDSVIQGAGTVNVWFSPHDVATLLAGFLPWHPWGSQGRDGYVGTDSRYKQFNEDMLFYTNVGHSGVFELKYSCQTIIRELIERL